MKSTQIAQAELNALKNDVIGIAKIEDKFELVLLVGENTIDTINITQFGTIQRNFCCPQSRYHWILFPNNKNMNDMLDNPFEWDAFMKSFSV